MSMVWFLLWDGAKNSIKPLQYNAMTYYGISNPSMDVKESNFCRYGSTDPQDIYECSTTEGIEGDSFNYNQLFENCTLYGAEQIGVIFATEDDKHIEDYELANEILTGIFNNISHAYVSNN